jgi:hypothetical protein
MPAIIVIYWAIDGQLPGGVQFRSIGAPGRREPSRPILGSNGALDHEIKPEALYHASEIREIVARPLRYQRPEGTRTRDDVWRDRLDHVVGRIEKTHTRPSLFQVAGKPR